MFMQREALQQVTCTTQKDLFAISNRLQPYPPITRRFIVLVPAALVDIAAMLHTIWAMARPDATSVLFLGLVGRSAPEEDEMRLCLATLASLTRDDQVDAQTHIARETDWVNAVRQVWRPGDVVICQAEQMISRGLLGWRPLWQSIENSLAVPVYIVSGVVSPQQFVMRARAARTERVKRLLSSTLASMLIVAGFFYVQFHIDLVFSGVLRAALLCMSGVLEAGLLGMWNMLIG